MAEKVNPESIYLGVFCVCAKRLQEHIITAMKIKHDLILTSALPLLGLTRTADPEIPV